MNKSNLGKKTVELQQPARPSRIRREPTQVSVAQQLSRNAWWESRSGRSGWRSSASSSSRSASARSSSMSGICSASKRGCRAGLSSARSSHRGTKPMKTMIIAAGALALASCSAQPSANQAAAAHCGAAVGRRSDAYMRKAEADWAELAVKPIPGLMERILADDYVGVNSESVDVATRRTDQLDGPDPAVRVEQARHVTIAISATRSSRRGRIAPAQGRRPGPQPDLDRRVDVARRQVAGGRQPGFGASGEEIGAQIITLAF